MSALLPVPLSPVESLLSIFWVVCDISISEKRGVKSVLMFSPKLRDHLTTPRTIYAGIDPSASSLHVGNLLPLFGLLHLYKAGHNIIPLIGGATGPIGDPSGRKSERPSLSPEQLANNASKITAQVEHFLERGRILASRRFAETHTISSPSHPESISSDPSQSSEAVETVPVDTDGSEYGKVEVLNNLDWFKDIRFLEFLSDVGKLARVNIMLARERQVPNPLIVKSRLNSYSGISFTEFSYQLLQAYDFLHLYRKHGCTVQLGGSDQWGNIVAGIDLIKRVHSPPPSVDNDNVERVKKSKGKKGETEVVVKVEESDDETQVYGLTIPLLTTSNGEKFGKSAGNAIWLDESMTSVSEFYQFFYRTEDADVERYLKLLTFIPLPQIEEIMREHGLKLARELTELVHGEEGVSRAETIARILYHTPLRELKSDQVLQAFRGDPRFHRVDRRNVTTQTMTKLAVLYGLVRSRAEATRAVQTRGLYLNEFLITDPRSKLSRSNLIDQHIGILRVGTRKHVIFYVD
ncbi:tyrosine-tRNA ligase [Tremella mesenterica]|uniref:tyrosine--tRNA ligase n=1 Tax=Tremella mesenterica TaxID=5217 RepID=A0A4Q1BMU5_TREME|nr:tyrosine-tRNA ligase [Tremella mesenterica]